MVPSSRFALSLKPNVAYLVLNFCPLWKKQTTFPSLAYAGIPYQSLGARAGALALMMAWSRLPMARSGSRISAIFASTAPSPSVLSRGPRRAAAFSSWTRSFIAARSSSVNPLNFFFGLIETSPSSLYTQRRTRLQSSASHPSGDRMGIGKQATVHVAATHLDVLQPQQERMRFTAPPPYFHDARGTALKRTNGRCEVG